MRLAKAGLIALASCSRYGQAQTILGTGSAFAQPIYTKWAQDAKASTGVELNYQASGSGVGQNQVLSALTDFGAWDVPMDDSKLQQANILQFPTVVGGGRVRQPRRHPSRPASAYRSGAGRHLHGEHHALG